MVKRLADVTASPDAGLVSVSPVMVKIAPITAVNRNSQQKRMAGGGSLLQTASMPLISRSIFETFFAVVLSFM